MLRGPFRSRDAHEWCNRRVLARIHRRTLGTLRRDIEPVSTADFVRFLYRWQHVAPMYRLHGIEGTLAVIKQLEGFEVPAVGWETQILPRRIASYKPEHLDRLCQSGEVMWGRLSPHPALASVERVAGRRRRVRPTKLVPISLFAREGSETLIARGDVDVAALSHPALDVLGAIERRGAPFFADLARETGRLPAEIEEALWELVAAGLVTADGFDALRSPLADSRRRLGEKAYGRRPRASSSRWTLPAPGRRPTIDASKRSRAGCSRAGASSSATSSCAERIAPPWRELLMVLRRMEAQGEVRGGRFVRRRSRRRTVRAARRARGAAGRATRCVARRRAGAPLDRPALPVRHHPPAATGGRRLRDLTGNHAASVAVALVGRRRTASRSASFISRRVRHALHRHELPRPFAPKLKQSGMSEFARVSLAASLPRPNVSSVN